MAADRIIEHGRSMVEMLGVLVIVGILTIGTLYGYRRVANGWHAVELINESNKRASIVAMQLQQNRLDFSMDELGSSQVAGATFGMIPVNDSYMAVTISDVSEEVCEIIMNRIGNNTPALFLSMKDDPGTEIEKCKEENNTYALVYRRDLSTDIAEIEQEPNVSGGSGDNIHASAYSGYVGEGVSETGSKVTSNIQMACDPAKKPGVCSKCSDKVWMDSNDLCDSGEYCLNGSCIPVEVNKGRCLTNDDCQNATSTSFYDNNADCSKESCFCFYSHSFRNRKLSSTGLESGTGVCVTVGRATGEILSNMSPDGEKYVTSSLTMDRFSANNYCQSQGKSLVGLDQIGLGDWMTHCAITGDVQTVMGARLECDEKMKQKLENLTSYVILKDTFNDKYCFFSDWHAIRVSECSRNTHKALCR